MALVIIDRVAMPELADMDADKIAALMLQRAPRAEDLIVEITDPTAHLASVPAATKPRMPPMSPRRPIKSMLKGK